MLTRTPSDIGFVRLVVFALVASLGIASGVLAFEAKPALTGVSSFVENASSDPTDNVVEGAGQYEDAETGLYYNRFRYYDPEAGGYTQQDPIGLAGGFGLHAYVHDPLAWVIRSVCRRSVDPGERSTSIIGT